MKQNLMTNLRWIAEQSGTQGGQDGHAAEGLGEPAGSSNQKPKKPRKAK